LNGNPTDLKARHEDLQARLSARDSILHFAHAAVSGLGAGMALTAAYHLIRLGSAGVWPKVALAVGGLLAFYALVRVFLGHAALRRELVDFEALRAVRRELDLEDVAALLPKS
jgi:hypothetical protein